MTREQPEVAKDSASGGAGADSDAWRDDDRARTEALRARIASLAAGPDELAPVHEHVLQSAVENAVHATVSEAISATLRDLLPALIDQHIQGAIAEFVAQHPADTPDPAVELPGLEPRLAALEDALEGLSGRVEALARDAAVETSGMFEALRRDVTSLASSSRGSAQPAVGAGGVEDGVGGSTVGTVLDEIDLLRGDMASALEYVQDQLAQQAETGFARTDEALSELRERPAAAAFEAAPVLDALAQVSDEVRVLAGRVDSGAAAPSAELDSVVDELRAARDELAAARTTIEDHATSIHSSIENHAELVRAEMTAALDPAKEEFAATTEAQRADLAALADGVRDDVATLVEDVAGRVATGAAAATTAAEQSAVAYARTSLDDAMAQLREVAASMERQVGAGGAELARFADGVVGAGRAIIEHLAARDLLLEQVRDELAAQLLSDLAAGMSQKDRTAASRKMAGLLQRRRDARDAEQWRAGRPAAPLLPPGIENEAEVLERILSARPLSRSSEPNAPGPETGAQPEPARTAATQAAVKRASAKSAPSTTAPAGASAAGGSAKDDPQPTSGADVLPAAARRRPSAKRAAPVGAPAPRAARKRAVAPETTAVADQVARPVRKRAAKKQPTPPAPSAVDAAPPPDVAPASAESSSSGDSPAPRRARRQ